mmetsp:Transcript_100/g.278  ORF Transcript_100/g.278 Transcript_100/m.278 type:complete len:98 (+) Transcript_100:1626-1919(+)
MYDLLKDANVDMRFNQVYEGERAVSIEEGTENESKEGEAAKSKLSGLQSSESNESENIDVVIHEHNTHLTPSPPNSAQEKTNNEIPRTRRSPSGNSS